MPNTWVELRLWSIMVLLQNKDGKVTWENG